MHRLPARCLRSGDLTAGRQGAAVKGRGISSMMSRSTRRSGGFSYVEVLVATVVIAISLVPALEALQTGLLGSQHHKSSAADHYNLTAKLEEVLQNPSAPSMQPPPPQATPPSQPATPMRSVRAGASCTWRATTPATPICCG